MITLTQLGYIVAVERFGNFHLAAKSCYVTQPTLSMQIRKLEDDLGVVIFDRSSQPVTPTPIGRKILDQSRVVLNQVSIIDELITSEKNEVAGELRLAVIPTLAPYLLPLFLAKFNTNYHKVQLFIEERRTSDIIEDLKRNRIDIGLLATPLGDESIVEHPLFEEPFYVYASKDSPLAELSMVRDQDLRDESLLLLAEGHCLREQTLRVCRQRQGDQNKASDIHFASGSIETLCRLVENGHGFTLIPELARHAESRKSGRVVGFTEPVPSREVSLVVHHSFVRHRLLSALAETIKVSIPAELRKNHQAKRTIPLS